jgi:hypothetical protein
MEGFAIFGAHAPLIAYFFQILATDDDYAEAKASTSYSIEF